MRADDNWDARYAEYRQTQAWRQRCALVRKRERDTCQGCMQAFGQHVHHLTYARVGDELLTDLVLYCQSCHERAHGRSATSPQWPASADWTPLQLRRT
jgi:hypothetical protein